MAQIIGGRLMRLRSLFLAFPIIFSMQSMAISAQIEGLIETRILEFDPQSGVKSQHFFFIDFDNKTVTDAYETGSTDFFGVELPSIRNQFSVSEIKFGDDSVTFVISGTTASGVGIVPSIDYKFKIVSKKDGIGSITGCHDGYPAYLIQFNGKNVYDFKHKSKRLLNLFGSCDTSVDVSTR